MIRVANSKALDLSPDETAIYIGRGRAPAGMEHAHLGNPYRVGPQYAQGEAAAAYLNHLRARVRAGGHERRKVLELARRLNAGERLVRCCWCYPKPCHGDSIRAAIEGYAARLAAKERGVLEEPL